MFRGVVLVATLLVLIFGSTALAQWQTQTVDNSGDVGKWSSMAYDSNGFPHIVYYLDSPDQFGDRLMYAVWNGTGGWEIKEVFGCYDGGSYGSRQERNALYLCSCTYVGARRRPAYRQCDCRQGLGSVSRPCPSAYLVCVRIGVSFRPLLS